MKVGDLVKSADWWSEDPIRRKVGLLMEIDPDNNDAENPTNTYFVQWNGDADWTFLYEDDFEVISERG